MECFLSGSTLLSQHYLEKLYPFILYVTANRALLADLNHESIKAFRCQHSFVYVSATNRSTQREAHAARELEL